MKDLRNAPIYKNPFSRAYWKDAAMQLFDIRILCVTAILIALRVVLKSAQIPVGPSLNITVGFFVNALGASIFGPVVAIVAAAISDTLGCLLFPVGPYFFPFIFEEISGSLIFALFLWRSNMTATRVIASRFSVVAITNLMINPTLMMWYYDIFYGKSYAFMTIPRVVKNLALFPAEAFLLTLFMGAMIPVVIKLGLSPKTGVKPILSKKHISMLAVFFVIAAIIVAGYYSLFIPTQPKSESITSGDLKLTVKSDRGTYNADDLDEKPFRLVATLKNSGDTDVTAWENSDSILQVVLVFPGDVHIPMDEITTKHDLTSVAADSSISVTHTYTWTEEQLESIKNDNYDEIVCTAICTAAVTVDGEEHVIGKNITVKIK